MLPGQSFGFEPETVAFGLREQAAGPSGQRKSLGSAVMVRGFVHQNINLSGTTSGHSN